MPRASLHTIGCRLNQAETAVLADQFRSQGYELVEFGQPTDLFVLNTCTVTESAEADCRNLVRRTRRLSPDAFITVTGCYAQTGVHVLREMHEIDLVVGTQHKMELPRYITSLARRPAPEVLHTRALTRDDFTLPGIGDYEHTRAHLKVQDGCNFMCSFCLIPFARGHERSRRLDDVVREAEGLVARGHRELVITGVNVGQYNFEGASLLKVIESLEGITGVERIRISSIEPTTISEALLERMSGPSKLCPHLHVPVQSGDDGILQAMNRRYTAREYAKFIERAVRTVPDLALGTDVMVGFPGEWEDAFANTRALLEDLPFAYFHVFSYSARPKTPASKRPEKVASREMRHRSSVLCALSRAKRIEYYQRYVGRSVSVLFETENTQGLFIGLTPNYIRVGVQTTDGLANQIHDVSVYGVMDGLALGRIADQ
jgi:threonylcarbamoyladenosine tRNA methylthiotransferase MtaB